MSALNQPHFQDADKAREYLEALRWPNGPICPHCGSIGDHWKLEGKATRPGLWKCRENACREQFTVTVGTVFEKSKIPLNVWLQAVFLLCASKKGMSSHQLHRTLGVTYKTAWFMTHRIREAMRDDVGGLLGGGGSTVEVDETFVGRKWNTKIHKKPAKKQVVLALVERNGKARSIHITDVTGKTLKAHVDAHLAKDSHLMTDDYRSYKTVAKGYAKHSRINHSLNAYVRGNVHTNTVEGFFSIFKRGVIGTYQHLSSQHLQRYMHEFDFRYNHRAALGVTDDQRTAIALRGITGKRLTYKTTNQAA